MTLSRFLRRLGGASGIRISGVVAVVIAAGLGAWMLGVASANGVPRYQFRTATLTANVNYGAYIHTYDITLNPCDHSFAGTGGVSGISNLIETVSGSFSGSYISITFDSLYSGGYNDGYEWTYEGPLSGGTGYGPNSQTFHVSFSLTNVKDSTTTYANHGDFVSQNPDKNDAAHSCIGMPLPHSWSVSGTIDSSNPDGTTITLPDAADGTYLIQVSGTWSNIPPGTKIDAEYVSQDGVWDDVTDGVAADRLDQGDLMIDNGFVNWGAYNSAHEYSLIGVFGGSVNLTVFDGTGEGATAVPVPAWYGDNSGSLNYTITYLQP